MSVFETQSASIPLSRRLNGVPDLACPVPGFRCLELPPAAKAALCSHACPPSGSERLRLLDLDSRAPGQGLYPGPLLYKGFVQSLAQSLWLRPRTKALASWTANLYVCTSPHTAGVQVGQRTCAFVQVGQRLVQTYTFAHIWTNLDL